MGSNSNQSETSEERLARLGSTIKGNTNLGDSNFQSSTGASIRGILGVDKGNEYIKFMKNLNK